MDQQQIKGKWMELRGMAKQRWGKLTDDDLDRIDGRRDELVGRIQQRYGHARDQVEREVDAFLRQR
jgi:uncharacterized protein YjbJ (UPF0337 family)